MKNDVRRTELGRLLRVLVLLFFFGSGLASLVLEVAWTRMLGVVFGNTVFAASTVLTAFMLGLALGSLVLGRVADRSQRPLMLYGCLELGIGLYAIAFPLLSAGANSVYAWFFQTLDPSFAFLCGFRFVLSLLLLLPPCFLMGGTLPVLGRFLGHQHREPGQAVGYLYAANTIGAVAGCFLGGFVLLKGLGVRGSLFAAAGVALTIGALAVASGYQPQQISKRERKRKKDKKSKKGKKRKTPAAAEEKAPPPSQAVEPLSPGVFRLVLLTFGVAGFCSLAYEVLWTRVLLFVMSTSVYSFATMLTIFLAGIAIGSFVSALVLVPRIRRPLLWFGIMEVLVGLTALASVALLAYIEAIDLRVFMFLWWADEWRFALTLFVDAFCVLFVPTFLMGAVFPIVLKSCLREQDRVGGRVGQVYAAGTIGNVLGSFAAGFILLPLLGAHRSLLLLVGLNFAVGIFLVWRVAEETAAVRIGLTATLATVAVAAFFLVPANVFHRTINTSHNPSNIIFMKEHPTGTVTVHEFPNKDRLLATDGVDVAGLNFMLRSTQKLQGYIPLVLHPNPRRVVQIGFGSGETARVGLDFGVADYTVVEICPAIFDAGKHLEEVNNGSYRDARIRKVIMDGKNFALLSDEKFDIVMNDSIFPGSGGSSALYTYDHFLNCRERLAEGGLFSCWVPLDLRPPELRMILRSFQEVFPHTSFWVASNCLNKHALILGTLSPLQIDFARVKKTLARPEIAADLRAVAIDNVYDFLDCFVCDEESIREWTASDPLNTDAHMQLEFSCAVPKSWEATLAEVLVEMIKHHRSITLYLTNLADSTEDLNQLNRRHFATKNIFLAQVAELRRMPFERKGALELALRANPGEVHVKSCEDERRQEVEDVRQLLSLMRARGSMQGYVVFAERLADRLYLSAHQPNRPLDVALYREAADLYRYVIDNGDKLVTDSTFTRLAEIQLGLGRPQEAERLCRQCLERWPRCAPACDLLARVYMGTGRRDLARRYIEKAVDLAPESALYKEHHRQILGGAPPRPTPGR